MGETKMGGAGEDFPETVWSSILSLPESASGERRERLNELFSRYWRPVYAYVRANRRCGVEDGKDLTQAFFSHILESDLVSKFEPGRGRFRHYLKGAVRNFLRQDHRDTHRLKRGGGTTVLSLNVESMETGDFARDLRTKTPDEVFDGQWAEEVMEQALTALRRRLVEEGKAVYFQVYETYALFPEGSRQPTYAEVAQDLGISENDVRNHLHHARTRLQQLTIDIVRDSVSSVEDLEGELQELFRS